MGVVYMRDFVWVLFVLFNNFDSNKFTAMQRHITHKTVVRSIQGGRMTTKQERVVMTQRVNRCTTHYPACDCREYKAAIMKQALEDIMRHGEIVGGNMAKYSTIWHIAYKGLNCFES